jgi:hypothetical protein
MAEIIILNLLESIKYFLIFQLVFNGKLNNRKKVLLGCIWLISSICILSFALKRTDLIIVIIAWFLFLYISYQGKVTNKIILFIASLVVVNYIDLILYAIISYITEGKIWTYYVYKSVSIDIYEDILIYIITIMVGFIIHRRKFKKNWLGNNIHIMQWVLFSASLFGFYFICSSVILYMVDGQPDNKKRLLIVLLVCSAITIASIIAFFIYSNRLKHQNDVHIETEGLYGESLGLKLAYGEQVHDDYEKVRQFRHDFRHHIAAMEGLVYGGEYSELEKYMGQLSQKDKELNRERVRYTGNFMVDSIIFGITRDQKFKEVDFQFDGGLPSNLGVKDIDICGVLANALENAMEACLKGNDRKAVIMKAGCYENMISFQIKNTYDSSRYKALAGGGFYSSKEGDGHGYGIQNMERVVKSYNGRMEYNVDPEWVTVDIFLQQKDEI